MSGEQVIDVDRLRLPADKRLWPKFHSDVPHVRLGAVLGDLARCVYQRAGQIITDTGGEGNLANEIAMLKSDLKSALNDTVDAAVDAAWAMQR